MTAIGEPSVGAHTTAEALRPGQMISDEHKTFIVTDNQPIGGHHYRVTAIVLAEKDQTIFSTVRRIESTLHAHHPIDGCHTFNHDEPARLKALHEAAEQVGQPMRVRTGRAGEGAAETSIRICGVDVVAGMEVVAYGGRWPVVSVRATGAQPIVRVRSASGEESTIQPGAIMSVIEAPWQK